VRARRDWAPARYVRYVSFRPMPRCPVRAGCADSVEPGDRRPSMPASTAAARAAPELFLLDANGDGRVTIGDASGWLQHAFFVPGDWTLWAIATYAPPLARFLEVDAAVSGGLASGIVSACEWAVAIVAVGMASAYVRDVDRRLTRAAIVKHGAVSRRV